MRKRCIFITFWATYLRRLLVFLDGKTMEFRSFLITFWATYLRRLLFFLMRKPCIFVIFYHFLSNVLETIAGFSWCESDAIWFIFDNFLSSVLETIAGFSWCVKTMHVTLLGPFYVHFWTGFERRTGDDLWFWRIQVGWPIGHWPVGLAGWAGWLVAIDLSLYCCRDIETVWIGFGIFGHHRLEDAVAASSSQ